MSFYQANEALPRTATNTVDDLIKFVGNAIHLYNPPRSLSIWCVNNQVSTIDVLSTCILCSCLHDAVTLIQVIGALLI